MYASRKPQIEELLKQMEALRIELDRPPTMDEILAHERAPKGETDEIMRDPPAIVTRCRLQRRLAASRPGEARRDTIRAQPRRYRCNEARRPRYLRKPRKNTSSRSIASWIVAACCRFSAMTGMASSAGNNIRRLLTVARVSLAD